MSRDLIEALSAATNTSPYGGSLPPDPPARGAAPAAKSSALLPGGQSGGTTAALEIGPAKVLLSSDGLFAFSFPATAKTSKDGTTYTLGVIETTP